MDPQTLSSLLASFSTDGYCVVRGAIPRSECDRFLSEQIAPALAAHADISLTTPSTWLGTSTSLLPRSTHRSLHALPSTPPPLLALQNYLPGAVIGCRAHNGDPIRTGAHANWPALKTSPPLTAVLDALHGGASWSWKHSNIGRIHLRFPVPPSTAPVFHRQWHVDGNLDPHPLSTPTQSVIALPTVRDVGVGGGNTAVLRGSHTFVARALNRRTVTGGFSRFCGAIARAWGENDVVDVAPCAAGDVVVLHPLVVHSSSLNTGGPVRVTFNVAARWKGDHLDLEDGCGEIGRSVRRAVEVPTPVAQFPFWSEELERIGREIVEGA